MKRTLLYFAGSLILMVSVAWGQITQTIEIASSPNPVGSGARAIGMGGAFIGVADDATAASWNPGGLIQLETPEVSVVGAYNARSEDTTYQAFPEASGPQDISTTELNYLSAAYPFNALGTNMIVSLNYQHLFDFNKEVQYAYSFSDPTPPPLTLNNRVDYEQIGAWRALSPAFAFQATPFLSFGLTLNIWDHGIQTNQWESRYRGSGTGTFTAGAIPFTVNTSINETYELTGFRIDPFDPFGWENVNYHLGMLWNVSSKWTLGAVFKSPWQARMMHDYRFHSVVNFPTVPQTQTNTVAFSEEVRLDMPMSYGVGAAVRVNDALTFDLDLYRTEWGEFTLRDGAGNETNPITGKPKDQSPIDATTQVRVGGEYLFIGQSVVVPVRAGVFYDPEPAENSPDDFFGFSVGSGVAWKNIVYDIAYQYRFGRGVRSTTVGNEEATQDVDQHSVYMSIIFHFN